MIRVVVVVMLLAIIVSLVSGLYFLHRDRGASRRMVRALTWRIGLAIGLFFILMLAFRFGLIPGYNQ